MTPDTRKRLRKLSAARVFAADQSREELREWFAKEYARTASGDLNSDLPRLESMLLKGSRLPMSATYILGQLATLALDELAADYFKEWAKEGTDDDKP